MAIVLLFQSFQVSFSRVWSYLSHKYSFGPLEGSVATLIVGAVILAAALLLSRMLSKLLQRRISRRAYLDPGLRYTIGKIAQYLVVALGLLFALSFGVGLNLTSVAVIFTALSVGIGFGLQYIAADIAAGFILLFERPVRVGDRVTIDKDEGDVQSINLRTTVVNTNDSVSVIVPNSRLIRERLINWSYGDPRARISIPVGVAYGADVDLTTKTLLRAAEGVDNVVSDPPPRVQFVKFNDWSLDFRLLVWSNRPRRHVQIRSDINYRIERLFRESGIEIPVPQTEFRLRGGNLHADNADDLLATNRPDEDEPQQT